MPPKNETETTPIPQLLLDRLIALEVGYQQVDAAIGGLFQSRDDMNNRIALMSEVLRDTRKEGMQQFNEAVLRIQAAMMAPPQQANAEMEEKLRRLEALYSRAMEKVGKLEAQIAGDGEIVAPAPPQAAPAKRGRKSKEKHDPELVAEVRSAQQRRDEEKARAAALMGNFGL